MTRAGDHWPRKYKWPPLICVIKQSSTVAAPQWQETLHAATVSYVHTFQLKHRPPQSVNTHLYSNRFPIETTNVQWSYQISLHRCKDRAAVKSLSVMVLKPKYNLLWIKSKKLKSRVNNIYQLKIHFQALYVFNHCFQGAKLCLLLCVLECARCLVSKMWHNMKIPATKQDELMLEREGQRN